METVILAVLVAWLLSELIDPSKSDSGNQAIQTAKANTSYILQPSVVKASVEVPTTTTMPRPWMESRHTVWVQYVMELSK